jgi:hypothetical protein
MHWCFAILANNNGSLANSEGFNLNHFELSLSQKFTTNITKTPQLTPLLSVASGIEIPERSRLNDIDEFGARKKIVSRSTSSNLLGSSAMLLVDGTRAYHVHAACSNSSKIKLLTIQLAAAGVV